MNLVLLFSEDFTSATRVQLTDYRAQHIREVHRAAVGTTLRVGLVNGGIGDGTVATLTGSGVELDVCIPEARPETPRVSIILALPRPQTLKKVLETVGAFGLQRLVLIDTARVQKDFFLSRLLKDNAWMRHLRLGMEQGGRTYLPEISFERSLEKFLPEIEGFLPNAARLIAHPGAHGSLWETPLAQSPDREILIAIGPEGGWLDHEVAEFVERGFLKIRLDDTIHRVENAVTALLSQIEFLRMKPLPV